MISCNQRQKENKDHSLIPSKVEAPGNIISLTEASTIYDNYSKHRVSLIEPYEMQQRAPEEKFEASRFVDFDYETIKQYIAYIDQEAEKAGVKKVSKLRLYFANYPNEDKFPNGIKVVHKRQNSIFMVPTLDMEGINYGFYIGSNGNAVLIKDWKDNLKDGLGLAFEKNGKSYAGFSSNLFLTSSLQEGKSLALNFGQGGPPPKTDF
jgi:hypothetical protein